MGNLSLTLATGPYDRVEAIAKGVVRPEGIDVTCLQIQSPPEIFTRMMKTRAFDLCEMSLSTYLTRRSRGSFPFIALPVFPSRLFRHAYVYVNRDQGIAEPGDLNGKRVGVQEYGQTAAVLIRGILQHRHGVELSSIRWVEGGVNTPRPPDDEMDLRPAGTWTSSRRRPGNPSTTCWWKATSRPISAPGNPTPWAGIRPSAGCSPTTGGPNGNTFARPASSPSCTPS